MSSRSITDPLSVPATIGDRSLRDLVARPLQRVAFWAAIALPFVHVPLLVTGLDSRPATIAFAVLVVLNVAALFAGHYYDHE